MAKVFLVIQREFLSRVKKKSFLIATILTPLIFPAIMGIFLWIATEEKDSQQLRIIEVVDENNFFFLESNEQYAFSNSNLGKEEAKQMIKSGQRYGMLFIPKMENYQPQGIVFMGEENPSMSFINTLESNLKRRIEDQKLFDSGIDPNVLNAIKTKVSIQSMVLNSEGEEKITNASINYGIGFLSGILIYIFIFVYGNQIMQGVIEEKSSRIIEILVSSLKPFQLMLGKILGIGAVGLTQFLIWVVLIGALSSVMMGWFGLEMPQQQMMNMANPELSQIQSAPNSEIAQLLQVLMEINYIKILSVFIFYFVGGYLLYGAFFAAIGAAVDSPSDAQQFMMPVTIPLLVSYFGLFIFVLDDPNSKISFWLSIIPFSSPIAMMGRINYGVPIHELILSMLLLIAGFFATTWFAGKIYRIGILVHGTKVNYKTLWRWITTK
jgi:ABC-2 type transport system permease protein